MAWLRTLTSAAVYTTLIVTFVFQVARVEGVSMAPTLADQDRLVVNKLVYSTARLSSTWSSCTTLNTPTRLLKRVRNRAISFGSWTEVF